MAKIEGVNFQGDRWFSICPLAPATAGEDATEYQVTFWTEMDNVVTNFNFSVRGWQNEHTGLWLIARLFAQASNLVGARVSTDLWQTGGSEFACVYKHCDWLRVILWALTRQRQICAEFFIQDDNKPNVYQRFFLQTSISDAEQFGRVLEQQIINAAPKWWAENR